MLPVGELRTSDGQEVEIIDTGLANRSAGPDFFNSKLRIGGVMWVGNVEIHTKSSDWYAHGHDKDHHYDNVVLHVASEIDTDVRTCDGKLLPQLRIVVPQGVEENYAMLLNEDRYPPCYRAISTIPSLSMHAWMSALLTERLENKTVAVEERLKRYSGSWEDTYFVTLSRNFGFGVNGEAFETWAESIQLMSVGHHRDDIFQIEAFFMGQAGLLDAHSMPDRHKKRAMADDYFNKLAAEYTYLAHKFRLTHIDPGLWKLLRLRPQNFPYIRLSQLANMYYKRRTAFADLLDCCEVKDVEKLFSTNVTEYWKTHYMFGEECSKSDKNLSASSKRLLIVNTAVPMLFAYGKNIGDDSLCERALRFMEQIKAENNHIVRMWKECGMDVRDAGDSQALIELKKVYCDRKDCLRCRIGYEYLKIRR